MNINLLNARAFNFTERGLNRDCHLRGPKKVLAVDCGYLRGDLAARSTIGNGGKFCHEGYTNLPAPPRDHYHAT